MVKAKKCDQFDITEMYQDKGDNHHDNADYIGMVQT